jgi:branched-chain amino acid transport system permease protein
MTFASLPATVLAPLLGASFDTDLFLDQFVLGLQDGSIYASLALALVIIYRTTGLLNFAQGEMAMFSGFLAWNFIDNYDTPIGLAILIGVVLSFVGGALIELLLVRPVNEKAGTNPLPIVIVTIGLFLGLNALAQRIWGTDGKNFGSVFGDDTHDLGSVTLSNQAIGTFAVLAVEVAILWVVFQKTKVGLAIRGVASNRESAALVGVPVHRTLMFGWGLAAALGAVAGTLYFSRLEAFDTNTMQLVLIYSFAAATLGGFDSPVGAVVGGLIVGVVSNLMASGDTIVRDVPVISDAVGYFGGDLALAPAFILILLVLLLRPSGLFGKAQVSRV